MRLLPKIVLAVVLPVMAGAGAVLYVFAGSWQQTLERELVESARRELVARVDTVPAGLQAGATRCACWRVRRCSRPAMCRPFAACCASGAA